MKKDISWTPMGCGPYKAHDYPGFPSDLVTGLGQLDLGPEALFPAWELVRFAPGLKNPGKQRALMILVLALQLISGEGSTRLSMPENAEASSGVDNKHAEAPPNHTEAPSAGARSLEETPSADAHNPAEAPPAGVRKPEKGQLDRILEEFGITAEEQWTINELFREMREIRSGPAKSALAPIVGGPGDYRPLIIDHGCLYIQKMHVLENRLGRKLRQLMESGISDSEGAPAAEKTGDEIENALQEVFNSPPRGPSGKAVLDAEQKAAVRTALSGRIAVISGRPGSGKTSIVASLLRVLARVGDPPPESVALAAPTGKAADRMRQSIANQLASIPDAAEADRRLADLCPPAQTLHRLLGYSPRRDMFQHHENNPLSERLIIVDESSMVDLTMMDRLLNALRPGARVIFLGDADQLPSVDTGAVMRDLSRSGVAGRLGRVAVLKKSYRAREDDSGGKSILQAAESINKGTIPDGRLLAVRKDASELSFRGVEHLTNINEKQLTAFCERWLELLRSEISGLNDMLTREYISGAAGFDEETARDLGKVLGHYEKFRILCVTRIASGGTGTVPVNNWFHRRWSDIAGKNKGGTGNPLFNIGEPVMVTRNDYRYRLYNGDSGLVLMVRRQTGSDSRGAEPMAVFPGSGSFVAYPPEMLRGRLDLAWATTVHKAQGSEYDHVAVLLPRVYVRPLTRELLYTAVTRARKSVALAGSPEVLATGAERKIERESGLSDML